MFVREPKRFNFDGANKNDLGEDGKFDVEIRDVSWPEVVLKRVFDLISVLVILALFW